MPSLIQLVRYSTIAAILVISACSQEQGQNETTTDSPFSLRDFFAANYAEDMQDLPQTATRRGILDNNRAWNPQSEAFAQYRRDLREQRLVQLQGFDPAQLDAGDQLPWQLYQQELTRSIAADNFRQHHYAIHHYRGVHTHVPTFLINVHKIENLQNAEDYIARLQAVAPLFEQVIARMAAAAEQGIFLPDWSYPKIMETARNTISGAPFDEGDDSAIWADFKGKLATLDISPEQSTALLEQAREALLTSVAPSYLALIAESSRLMQLASADDGVWKHPDGKAFYAERLNYFTTTKLTADEIHQIGLREVTRIHDEMRGIMKQVGFEGDLLEFMAFMRSDEQFYYADDEAGRSRYLNEATALIDTMRENLSEAFGIFPQAELVVKRVEPFREQSAGKAFYQYPAADGSRPGMYYANLYDMSSMPTYQMEALAYHEGIPGHHMQLAIAIELEDVPEFQKYTTFTAFSEGWGLYSEMLPKEMGFYQDPYSDFGRMAMELWRAARLVVDTGLHHKRWTREEAIEYLVENTPNSVYDSTRAIERYLVMPGQATAYLIGKLKIVELREAAQAELGEQFDIREFHDEVLKDGRIPLDILTAKIEAWVQRVKAGKAA
jgi:uncharacterized protein (DUF885 family)